MRERVKNLMVLQIKAPTLPKVAQAHSNFEGGGEVQEKPTPARVGGEDADCQRVSEACVPQERKRGELPLLPGGTLAERSAEMKASA